jgi:hypothetical protein
MSIWVFCLGIIACRLTYKQSATGPPCVQVLIHGRHPWRRAYPLGVSATSPRPCATPWVPCTQPSLLLLLLLLLHSWGSHHHMHQMYQVLRHRLLLCMQQLHRQLQRRHITGGPTSSDPLALAPIYYVALQIQYSDSPSKEGMVSSGTQPFSGL